MTNFEYIRNLLEHKHMNEHDFAELLVVKIDDYNYTSNILFENFTTRQGAVEATIEKLKDTYGVNEFGLEFGLFDKIIKQTHPNYD